MFSKAKRFDDKPVGCGADVVYGPCNPPKPVGGVIPKLERFHDAKSDADSVHSDISSTQLFRTPKALRRVIPLTPKHKKDDSKAVLEELLSARTVEIRNKDDTIKDYECQIADLKHKIYSLEGDLVCLKISCDNVASVVVVSDENKNDSISKIDQLESEISSLKENVETLETAKQSAEDENEALKMQLASVESALCAICDMDADETSLFDKMTHLKRYVLDVVENLRVAEDFKSQLESQNKKLRDHINKVKNDNENQIVQMEESFSREIRHLNENAIEKMRICEIQFEQRFEELQSYSDMQINKEINQRYEEIQICQEIAEKEIMKYEKQINVLKNEMRVNYDKLNELCKNIDELRMESETKTRLIDQLTSNLSTSENMVGELNKAVEKLLKEKNMFSVALDSARQTVDVLTNRLRNSDSSVEMFKEKLENVQKLNTSYETEILDLQVEFSCFKDEYKQLLLTIANSKNILDCHHKEILGNNTKMIVSLDETKVELEKNISGIKQELMKDVDDFKKNATTIINGLEKKVEMERNNFITMKNECDGAYSKIASCHDLLIEAENKIESKDHEINEKNTENIRLSGTLAASEQEKNELKILCNEFLKLVENKDIKIYELVTKMQCLEEKFDEIENQNKKFAQFLEATEFIVKEKDFEINEIKNKVEKLSQHNDALHVENAAKSSECNDLLHTIENQKCEIKNLNSVRNETAQETKELQSLLREIEKSLSEREDKIAHYEKLLETNDSYMTSYELLQSRYNNLEKELNDMTNKYTDLLGHHNYKQKIKHIIDLKSQKNALKEENENMAMTIQKQNTLIEKLKSDLDCSVNLKSSILQKKQILHSPLGKENRVNTPSHSPNRLDTSRSSNPSTPLRDLNR